MSRVIRTVMGASGSDAEDVLQDALLSLSQALPAFRGDSKLTTFAARIAARCAIKAMRRQRVAPRASDGLDHQDIADYRPGPAERIAAKRREEVMRRLLQTLPEIQAETFVLRVVLGLSLTEVAEATGAPQNTVRSRIRLARDALRGAIERQYPELVVPASGVSGMRRRVDAVTEDEDDRESSVR